MDLAFIIVVLSFAGLMQGLTGFGFGIVAMALLPFCMEFKLAATTVAAINLPMCLLTWWAYRQHFHWHDARGLIVGVALGAPLGVQLLTWGESTVLLRCLGGVMCGFALLDVLLMRFRWGPIPKSCAIPLGFLTGVFGGAFNIGGPPAVAYTYSQPWTKQQVVAVLQAMFSVSAVVRVTMLTHAGLLNSEVGRLTSLSLIPVLIGIWCGSRLLNRISQAHLKTGVLIFVFVMGVKYLVSPPASVSKQISAQNTWKETTIPQKCALLTSWAKPLLVFVDA